MKLISEKQAVEISTLETRLIDFYNTCKVYPAFSRPSEYPDLWQQVLRVADQIKLERGGCRILEIGAGRSGFGDFLKKSGKSKEFHLTSQDITAANVEFLRGTSDAVVTDNLDRLVGTWDVIFHSYAYEHLCRPREFNETIWGHLSVGGYLLIQCPRYDFPLYFPPCFDHLPFTKKLWHAFALAGKDFVSTVSARPQFTVFSDPAVFHLPFHRDRDAVHRVRRSDVRLLFANRAEISDFSVAAGGVKDWIVKNLLTLRVILRKTSLIAERN